MTLGNLMAKLSYRDYLVLRAVWEAYSSQWAEPESKYEDTYPSRRQVEENGTVIEKVELKLESVSLCFLDDYQDTRFPLFKVAVNGKWAWEEVRKSRCMNCVSDGIIEHRPGKSSVDPQEGCGALVLEMSYFNQKVYGWEPFLEAWR